MLKVAELMSESVLTLSPDSTLGEATQTLVILGVSGAPVIEADRLVGVFSKSDIVDDLSDGEINLNDLVGRTMSRRVITVAPDDDVKVAIRRFAEDGVHRVVVVSDSGSVVGIITALDIVKALHAGRLG